MECDNKPLHPRQPLAADGWVASQPHPQNDSRAYLPTRHRSARWAWCLSGMVLWGLVTGCSHTRPGPDTELIPDLKTLENWEQRGAGGDQPVSGLRAAALRDLALSVGARAGLATRMDQIHQSLVEKTAEFDRIFNFDALLMDNRVLPPVLVEARQSFHLAHEHRIRISDRQYQIVKQARFVTLAPTWRDYLLVPYPKPETPDPTLLPNTADEKKWWKTHVARGWQQGLEQADAIHTENLARLKRDYEGMIRYRFLLAQKMVSAPHVAKRNLGITGGGDALAVGDQTLEITALPALQPDARQWYAQVGWEDLPPVADAQPEPSDPPSASGSETDAMTPESREMG